MTYKLLTSLLAFTLYSITANAGTIVCSGTVKELSYHSPNNLYIRLSSMNTAVAFCNTDTEWAPSGARGYTTSPGACKAMYSTFLSAKATGATILYMYFDGDSVPSRCDGWSNWQKANIRYYLY